MSSEIRILVVADNVLARAGLAAMLDTHPDCDIVGQIASSQQLAEEVELYQPDVLLVDLGWQPEHILAHIAALSENSYPVVALLNDESGAAAALSGLATLEVYGLLLSEAELDTIVMAFQAVLNGLVVFDPELTDSLTPATSYLAPDIIIEALTPREHEVLQLLAQGMANKAIALQLGITSHTVKFHVNAIMTKLNAQSRTEAVVQATRAGLIIL